MKGTLHNAHPLYLYIGQTLHSDKIFNGVLNLRSSKRKEWWQYWGQGCAYCRVGKSKFFSQKVNFLS